MSDTRLTLCGRPVLIRQVELLPSVGVFDIQISLCSKKLSWEISLYFSETTGSIPFVSDLDITPILESMEGIDYSPYAIAEKALSIATINCNVSDILTGVADVLVKDFLLHQDSLISAVQSEGLQFLIEMLKGIPNSALLVEEVGSKRLALEFPLLDSSRLQYERLDYLVDALALTPIVVHISLSCSSSGQVITNSSLVFPPSMSCCQDVETPQWDYESLTIFEYVSVLEKIVLDNWEVRYLFMRQLQKISAVVELDAIDFAYAAVVLRAKQNQMFSMCSIEIKLTASFPTEPPMITFFDMKTTLSTIVEPMELSRSNYYDSSWPMESIADGVFLFCWDKLLVMSFGDTSSL